MTSSATDTAPRAPTSTSNPLPRAVGRVGSTVLWGICSIASALAGYELLNLAGVLPREFFPSVPAIATSLADLSSTGAYWAVVWETVRDAGLGLLIATVIAVPLGIALGMNDLLFRFTRFPVEFLRPIPAVAVIPLFVLVTGTGSETKWLLAAFSAVFPLLLQTVYGVRDVEPLAMETAAAFRIDPLRRFTQVVLPSSLPFIVTGLRIASTLALLVTVSVEIIVGAPGIGEAINLAQNGGALPEMYAYILTAGILGLVLNLGLTALERATMPWTPGRRKEAQ